MSEEDEVPSNGHGDISSMKLWKSASNTRMYVSDQSAQDKLRNIQYRAFLLIRTGNVTILVLSVRCILGGSDSD